MMEMIMKIKNVFVLLAFMLALLLPCSLNAQWGRSDNFFGDYKEPDYYNRGGEGYSIYLGGHGPGGTITNQTFDQPLPLGSGLIVMTVAGAGYVLLKRRKNNTKN